MRAADVISKLNLGTAKQVLSAEPNSPMEALLMGLLQEVTDRIGNSIDKWDVKASNRLKQSVTPVSDSKPGVISVAVQANFYWKYVNYGVNGTKRNWGAPTWGPAPSGTRSFKDSISDWIKDKGIRARPGQTYEQMTYLIMRGIREKGIEPRPFMTEVINKELTSFLERSIAEVYAASIVIEIKEAWL